ncbi:MAG: hypothetical protein KBD78_15130 [Oligoflexales bacterium]|nr:hypothetical protein [Oligoflexales bacterium]
MKLKVKAKRLVNEKFEDALKIMRLWPDYQRDVVHDLLMHVQYLNESIEKLETEIRNYKEIEFFEEKKQIELKQNIIDVTPQLSKSLKPTEKLFSPRGERYYYLLSNRTHDAYLNLNPSVNIDDMLTLANDWATTYSKPLLSRGDFNETPIFSNRFANAQEPSLI